MTGEKLLSQLLARMHICNPTELTNFCLKLPATADLAKFKSEVISKLVKEIEEKQFANMSGCSSFFPLMASQKPANGQGFAKVCPRN